MYGFEGPIEDGVGGEANIVEDSRKPSEPHQGEKLEVVEDCCRSRVSQAIQSRRKANTQTYIWRQRAGAWQ